MKIAITGATGFLGLYVVRNLSAANHQCRCWYRSESNRAQFADIDSKIDWFEGSLTDSRESMSRFVQGCDALVHAGLDRPGVAFRGGEGDLETFATRNIVGSLRLFEVARTENIKRAVFVSTCAVHEKILDDRRLDEAHPLWATTHYGAHKAAIEAFVHSFGLGFGFQICAVRPCGIYGLADPLEASKWFEIVKSIVHGEPVRCEGGGKVVHAADVANAIETLLQSDEVAGESFNCCDRYVSHWDVATIVKELTGSASRIEGEPKSAKHEICTDKIEKLGFRFGGETLLRETLSQLVQQVRNLGRLTS